MKYPLLLFVVLIKEEVLNYFTTSKIKFSEYYFYEKGSKIKIQFLTCTYTLAQVSDEPNNYEEAY
jgi:hypothetical protein